MEILDNLRGTGRPLYLPVGGRPLIPAMVFTVLLLTAALVLGCGGSSDSTSNVNDESVANFDDILVKRRTGTVKPHSVTIAVETKEGVICTWAYGLTTDYGLVTTHVDPSMAAPHTIHNVALTGLEPDSLYHYMFVAVGPSGTIYRSTDATFRTVPE